MKIALTGLPPSAGAKYPSELSGGMRKRAALARAIALDPELLFLDEPTAGLDPLSAGGFDELVQHLKNLLGLTIFMVTHDLDLLWRVADRVAFMVAGRIAGVGTMQELSTTEEPLVREYFYGARGRERLGAGMETKVNYALVGAFVLVLSVAIVAGVLWIASGGTAGKTYDTYLAYFGESVSGLNLQAPVKYKGVRSAWSRRSGSTAPIRSGSGSCSRSSTASRSSRTPWRCSASRVSRASPSSISKAARRTRRCSCAGEAGGYPVIATRPSLFRRLDTQVSRLVADLSQAAQRVNRLIDDETRAALQRTIRDLDTVVHALAGRSDAMSADAARTLDDSARASAELTETLRESPGARRRSSAPPSRPSARPQRCTRPRPTPRSACKQLRSEILPELHGLLTEARAVTESIGRLAQELEQSPNVLVIGREPTAPGPGE